MLEGGTMETVLTYQYRIKDSTVKKHLIQMASSVNFIWNGSIGF